jgi:hypothetical protein
MCMKDKAKIKRLKLENKGLKRKLKVKDDKKRTRGIR